MAATGFIDDVLGRVSRDEGDRWWQFAVALPRGTVLRGVIITSEARPSADCLRHVREVVRWLGANEPQLHRRVAAGMLEYLEREYIREPGKDQVDSAETIAGNTRIAEATFVETWSARICYETFGLLERCGWTTGVAVEIDAQGRIVSGPEFA